MSAAPPPPPGPPIGRTPPPAPTPWPVRRRTRAEQEVIVNGILCFVLVLVVLQLWLLTATMNAWLGGDDAVVWPAGAASAVCFALNAGLLVYVFRLDRR